MDSLLLTYDFLCGKQRMDGQSSCTCMMVLRVMVGLGEGSRAWMSWTCICM